MHRKRLEYRWLLAALLAATFEKETSFAVSTIKTDTYTQVKKDVPCITRTQSYIKTVILQEEVACFSDVNK